MRIAVGTLDRAGVAGSLIAIAVAGLLSFALYYYVPAILGMKTGYPLYVVGSSTFGTAGGYLMPGGKLALVKLAIHHAGLSDEQRFVKVPLP